MVQESPPTQSWLWNGLHFEKCISIPLSDRGFRYGMSVFESMPVQDGRVCFLPEHLDLIRHAASRKQFQFPSQSLEQVEQVLRGIRGSAFARIYITAGDGPPQAPADHCRVAIICEKRERVLPDAYSVWIDASTSQTEIDHLKTGNYWPNVTAFAGALHRGANEALRFNFNERLIGGAMANIFLKIGGRWVTPPPEDGARCGVIREWVKTNIEVHSQSIDRETLYAASEVFLTSSWIGVMPVSSLGGRSLEKTAEIQGLRERLEQVYSG
jgi:branched-subunit amino acid aminotransferase/4-amino-4-deoxychorismate lyase